MIFHMEEEVVVDIFDAYICSIRVLFFNGAIEPIESKRHAVLCANWVWYLVTPTRIVPPPSLS